MASDDIAIELRPRDDWEAADLGLGLGRAWFGDLAKAWLVAYVLPAIAIVALAPRPGLTGLLVWWCRPWAERALIDVMGRRSFGQPASVRAALRRMLTAPARPGPWLASLTWRRLSPMRTTWLAVWELEGLRGRAAAARVRVLGANGRGVALWCLIVMTAATVALFLTYLCVETALVTTPLSPFLESGDAREISDGDVRVVTLLVVLADALVAPWLVATVFGLYLHRRTDLEAWDIELVFRRMARRLAALLVLVGTLLLPALGVAQPARVPEGTVEAPATPPPAEPGGDAPYDPAAIVREILLSSEFGRVDTVQQWQFRRRETSTEPQDAPGWTRWLLSAMGLVARASRALMWAGLAGAVAWLIWTARRWRTAAASVQAVGPSLTYEGPAREATPSGPVLALARAHAEAGRTVEALALLYRGALQACVERAGVELKPGDTEAQCLARTRGLLPADADGTLRIVVRSWQSAAYAGRPPSRERVLAICDAYAQYIEEAS